MPDWSAAVDPASSEVLFRLSAFLGVLLVLASAEAVLPRRRRAFVRRDRWIGNLGLVIVDAVVVRAVPPITTLGVAALAETRGWGLLYAIGPVPAWVGIAGSIVLLDLAIYLQHVLFHALPVLWRLHRVHHTDPELDVTTGVRFHPIEMLLSVGCKAAAVAALGPPVLGVLLFEITLSAGSILSHANLRLPGRADRLIRTVIVTPDMHRVHHSVNREETDSNFGFTLSWWDRLFGTYRAEPRAGHHGVEIGVAGFDRRDVLVLHRLLTQPLVNDSPARCIDDLARASRTSAVD